MNTRTAGALAAATTTAVAALVACGARYVSPCEQLEPPSAQEQQLSFDIERDIGDVECDWEDGRWVEDHDLPTFRNKTTKTSTVTRTATRTTTTTVRPARPSTTTTTKKASSSR